MRTQCAPLSALANVGPECGTGANDGLGVVEQFQFLVGIDWATESHQICVIDRDRQALEEKQNFTQRERGFATDRVAAEAERRPADLLVSAARQVWAKPVIACQALFSPLMA